MEPRAHDTRRQIHKALKRQPSIQHIEGERNLISKKIVVIAIAVLLSFYVLGCAYAQPTPINDAEQGMLENEASLRPFHTPEFWLGPFLGLAGCFSALGAFYLSKRKHL